MITRIRLLSGGLVSGCGLLFAYGVYAMPVQPLTVHTKHGISYVSGGVSLNERLQLRRLGQDDNVQLTFAAKNRDYLSDVTVRIVDEKGRDVLNTVAQGPLLFAKLPAGKYTVHAATKGQAQRATFTAWATGKTTVYLTWDDSVLKTPSHKMTKR